MPRIDFVFLATAQKCAVLCVVFGLGMALAGFPESSQAMAQDWGIHEGVVEVSSSEVPEADRFDFLIVNSPKAILYAYIYDIDSRDGRISVVYEFFDDRNPFGVVVDVSRPPGPITAPWSDLDVIKTLQETPSAGRPPPQALDRLALGLLGTYHALRIERRDQIAEGPSQSNPYFTSISLRGQLSALESFEIRQTRKDLLFQSNPKRLEDCLFDNQGTDTMGSIVTSVTFPKPLDFRTAGNSPPTITIQTTSTEGRTRLKKYTVTKLAHRPSAEILSNVVFWDSELGGFLQDSIDEFSSLQEGHNVFVTIEAPPSFRCSLGEFEHHHQACLA